MTSQYGPQGVISSTGPVGPVGPLGSGLTNNLTSLLGIDSLFRGEELVIKEIFNIMETFKCADSWKRTIITVIKGIPRILFIIMLKHYISNPTNLIALLKSICWFVVKLILYKTDSYIKTEVGSLDQYCAKKLETFDNEGSSYGVPYYIERNDKRISVNYVPILHNHLFSNIRKDAEVEYTNSSSECTKFLCYNNGYKPHKPSELFPCANYIRLESIMKTYIDISTLNNCFNPLGVLVNGMPGLGKSGFAHYISRKNIFRCVYRVDLSQAQFVTMSPEILFKDIYHVVPVNSGNTLFMLDELDKYLEFYIIDSFNKLPKQENPNTILEEEHRGKIKLEFLLGLLGVLERSNITHPCAVIFCCNNFDTIFSGIDNTHFNSIKDRFMRVVFNICNVDEVANFLRYYNNRYQKTKYYDNNLEKLLEELDNRVEITFRQLNMLTTYEQYKFKNIIRRLNKEYINENNNIFLQSDQDLDDKNYNPSNCRSDSDLDNNYNPSDSNNYYGQSDINTTSNSESNYRESDENYDNYDNYETVNICSICDKNKSMNLNWVDNSILICTTCNDDYCATCGCDNVMYINAKDSYKICNPCFQKITQPMDNFIYELIDKPTLCLICHSVKLTQPLDTLYSINTCEDCSKSHCDKCLVRTEPVTPNTRLSHTFMLTNRRICYLCSNKAYTYNHVEYTKYLKGIAMAVINDPNVIEKIKYVCIKCLEHSYNSMIITECGCEKCKQLLIMKSAAAITYCSDGKTQIKSIIWYITCNKCAVSIHNLSDKFIIETTDKISSIMKTNYTNSIFKDKTKKTEYQFIEFLKYLAKDNVIDVLIILNTNLRNTIKGLISNAPSCFPELFVRLEAPHRKLLNRVRTILYNYIYT
jgi:hypothetical protein